MSRKVVYGQYVVPFYELEKVLPNEFKEFKEKSDEVLIFVNLSQDFSINNRFTMNDVYENCIVDDIEGSKFYRLLDDETFGAIEDRLSDIYNMFQNMLVLFKEKTQIALYSDFNYDEGLPFIYLNYYDVMEMTPKAKELLKMGVIFDWLD
jgi:hypothetical protein